MFLYQESGKHLGTKIENKVRSILDQDMNEKRAQYIQRNNELMLESAFADCVTKTKNNSIYNSHFHGLLLWYLLGLDAERIYKTWNTSIRKMFILDRTSHRYFIEPVSNVPHIKIALIKRFINFIEKLSCSTKICARNIFHTMKHDCRSNIGRNIRAIMKYCGKPRISQRRKFLRKATNLFQTTRHGKLKWSKNSSMFATTRSI